MKITKLIFGFTVISGVFAFSACSSKSTKTQEPAPVTQTVPAPAPIVQVDTAPSYTVANLGASTAGRSK